MAATTETVPVIHQCYTLSKVRFPSGTIIALDEHQAATRSHILTPVSDGVYTANDWLEFKAIEVIGLTQVPKSLDGLVSPCEVLEEALDDDPEKPGEAGGDPEKPGEAGGDPEEPGEAGGDPEEPGEAEAASEKPAKKPKATK